MASHGNPITATLAGVVDQMRQRNRAELEMLGPGVRLEGRRYLVTGANSGLGAAVTRDLAGRGAAVVMACRSGIPEAGEAIARDASSSAVTMRRVDLSDFAEIHRLCDGLLEDDVTLDGVICNAGLMPSEDRPTRQGFELMFGVNFMANVVLLGRLMHDGRLRASTPDRKPRVVVVASEAHRSAEPIDWDTFGQYREYGTVDGMKWYGHSKLASVTYTAELARRHPELMVSAICPGAVASNMAREAPAAIKPALDWVMSRAFASPAHAAEPVVYLAGADEIEGETGTYLHMRRRRDPVEHALDPQNGAELWARSHALACAAMGGVEGPASWTRALGCETD